MLGKDIDGLLPDLMRGSLCIRHGSPRQVEECRGGIAAYSSALRRCLRPQGRVRH